MEIFLLLIILVFVIISLNKSAANSKATQEAISKLKDEINSLNLKIDTQTLKAEEPQPEIVPVVTEEPQPAIREEIKAEEEKQIIEENPVVEEAPVQAAMSAAVSRKLQPETIPLQENAEIPVTEKNCFYLLKKSWLQTFKEKKSGY